MEFCDASHLTYENPTIVSNIWAQLIKVQLLAKTSTINHQPSGFILYSPIIITISYTVFQTEPCTI